MTAFRTGYGAAWLDLLGSLHGRYQASTTEHLPNPATAGEWLAEHGLAPAAPVTGADLEALWTLREALHRTAAATVRGEPPADVELAVIDRALAADRALRLGPRRDDEGAGLVVSAPGTAAEAAARLARQAVEDLTGPHRELLRFCGDDGCAGIFLDHTGRRRWCADERCGVRARVRAHRARARTAPGS